MKWTSAWAATAARFARYAAIWAAAATVAGVAQTSHPGAHNVTAVRHWSAVSTTRIAIEVSGEFEYRSDRLHDPERVYYDILNARPKFDNKRLYTEDVTDPFVKRIRVAETTPGVTRVVLDLSGAVEVNASVLSSPDRLIVELRRGAELVTDAAAPQATMGPQKTPAQPAAIVAPIPYAAPAQKTASVLTPSAGVSTTAASASTPPKAMASTAPAATASMTAAAVKTASLPAAPKAELAPEPVSYEPYKPDPAPPVSTTAAASVPSATSAASSAASTPATAPSTIPSALIPKPARHTSAGETSLVRALGLKLQRIVIDAGHGGHDEGTQGPKGLLEKELVLDVSLRLGKMIEEKMGAEVIYTRSDDTFIPLEGRTALANEKKADLFLSIHANSSPAPRITGVETYYLNFTDVKDSMETASRENAGSEKSIFELRDLLQKISLHDKASESRDFAERIQSALFAFSSKTFPTEKNRGVKKAPFVVLIGANMPSVLAEIGFVSNPREETLLKKPEYRQKLAEALYHGVSKYAESLSHFQLAAN